jgi:heterodimeric-type methylmalonyl-CoA mutase beta chain
MVDQIKQYTFEEWQAKATQDLKGKSLANLKLQSEPQVEIEPLFYQGNQKNDHTHISRNLRNHTPINAVVIDGASSKPDDLKKAKEQAQEALMAGANALHLQNLRFDALEEIELFFSEIWLDAIPVSLVLVDQPVKQATLIFDYLDQKYADKRDLIDLRLGFDPYVLTLNKGTILAQDLADLINTWADLIHSYQVKYPKLKAFTLNQGLYYGAGCDEAEDLAFTISSAVALMRRLEQSQKWENLSQIFDLMTFHLTSDSRFFHAIAKVRAFKQLWARICEICKVESQVPHITFSLNPRWMTRFDPAVNILRNTASTFAGIVAGVDLVYALPFDPSQADGELGQRLAKNTPILLKMESHLDAVQDATAGSYFIESLTEQFALKAWSLFQEIEAKGGFETEIFNNQIQQQIKQKEKQKAKKVAQRKTPITGVSEYPNLKEKPIAQSSNANQITNLNPHQFSRSHLNLPIETLSIHPIAEAFESLRDQSKAYAQKFGHYPKVCLLSFGKLSQHLARTSFIKNLVEAGGFEAIQSHQTTEDLTVASAIEQIKDSQAKIVILCGSDADVDPSSIELLNHDDLQALANLQIWRAGAIRDEAIKQQYQNCKYPLKGTIALGQDMIEILDTLWQHLQGWDK